MGATRTDRGSARSARSRLRRGPRELIIATNRSPVTFAKAPDGSIVAERGPGGLVTALLQVASEARFTWLATPVSELDRVALSGESIHGLPEGIHLKLVTMPDATYRAAYDGVATRLFYFFQHRLFDLASDPAIDERMHMDWRSGFARYAAAFGKAIDRELRLQPGAAVMLHDPHMYLVAPFVRRQRPHTIVTHFTGIPWPEPREWLLIPRAFRSGVIRGLLANDIVGFQTARDAAGFLDAVRAFVPEARPASKVEAALSYRGRIVRVRPYPIAIDPDATRAVASSSAASVLMTELAASGQRIIARVDRLDPSKNILRGFQAFRLLLERHPDLVGQVRFVAVLPPSRRHLNEYRRYARAVFAEVERINAQFGPRGSVVELHLEHDYVRGLATLAVADVVLVNSLADGMNLVAKEAVAVSLRNAAIVVSETTGAADDLAPDALTIAATDVFETASALHRGLTMTADERAHRLLAMRRRVESRDLSWWLHRQLADIESVSRERQSIEVPR